MGRVGGKGLGVKKWRRIKGLVLKLVRVGGKWIRRGREYEVKM